MSEQLPMDGEEILVLFGSQSGSAEAAAERIAKELPQAMQIVHADDDGSGPIITPKLMGLDDWLETSESNPLTRVVIIVVSSFGMGGAPMNAKMFRRRCDDILQDIKRRQSDCPSTKDDSPEEHDAQESKACKFLKGIHFCLLAFGDSSYKTFMMNPQRTLDCWTAAGATLMGAMGQVDSNKELLDRQEAIDDWICGIWMPIYRKIKQTEPLPVEMLSKATSQFAGTK